MRILNRPMFKYGGPIKEGVMHGMRNNYQSGQLVRPGPGRPGYKGPLDWKKQAITKVPALKNIYQQGLANIGKLWSKYKFPSAYSPTRKSYHQTRPMMERLGKYVRQHPIITGGGAVLGSQSEPAAWAAKTIAQAPVEVAQFATEALTPKKWEKYLPENEWWKWKSKSDWKPGDIRGEEGGDGDGTGTKTGLGAGAQFKESTAPIITASMRADLAKKQQNERLASYLDMMGYDRSKKTAMSDALIDASALVQDATTEAGSLKKADWGKLINRAIQTTSKRLDKPEQIREAVGLMSVKAAIEKDMMESKGGPLKQNAKDLVSAGVYKTEREALEHLSKKAGFEEVVGALSAKKDVDGKVLADAWRISGEGIPTEQVKGSNKYYKNFKENKEDEGKGTNIELAFVDEEIEDKKAGDVYVIDDRMIIVQKDGTLKYRW